MASLLLRHLVVGGCRRLSTCKQFPFAGKTLLELRELPQTRPFWPQAGLRGSWRYFTSSTGGGEESEGGKDKEEGEKDDGEEEGGGHDGEKPEDGEDGEGLGLEMLPVPRHHAIAPVNIPDVFPEVPVLPISRNPLFPRFVKMLEVMVASGIILTSVPVMEFLQLMVVMVKCW